MILTSDSIRFLMYKISIFILYYNNHIFHGGDPLKHKDKELILKQREIFLELEETKKHMQSIFMNLEYLTDPDLIDCYTYDLKATQVRYRYLLKLAEHYQLTCGEHIKDLVLAQSEAQE